MPSKQTILPHRMLQGNTAQLFLLLTIFSFTSPLPHPLFNTLGYLALLYLCNVTGALRLGFSDIAMKILQRIVIVLCSCPSWGFSLSRCLLAASRLHRVLWRIAVYSLPTSPSPPNTHPALTELPLYPPAGLVSSHVCPSCDS